MKKTLLVTAAILCAVSLTANASEGKHKLTPEQKALRKEIIAKYDTDKNGKLDKQERAKISQEDKERMQKAGLGGKKKHKTENNQSQ